MLTDYLLLLVITLYLGVFIPDLYLGVNAWGILTVWVTWIFALPIILEIIDLNIVTPNDRSIDYEIYNEENVNSLAKRLKRNKKIVSNYKS